MLEIVRILKFVLKMILLLFCSVVVCIGLILLMTQKAVNFVKQSHLFLSRRLKKIIQVTLSKKMIDYA